MIEREKPDLALLDVQMPELAAYRFDGRDGLETMETAMLAVVNNPDLKTARPSASIAHGQAFAARLLPDPQVGLAARSSGRRPSGNHHGVQPWHQLRRDRSAHAKTVTRRCARGGRQDRSEPAL